ncbi:MAG TPA: hypothetical protein PLU87_13175 [Sedimentisphaerales bacterium]|nr:hypothetical protein [Sedimentisphaerales bacterium]HRS11993.1 hypothetical protein [Sedimentisphaerales bacterium]HRV49049.1 hypothetical protein [Sedimentisphaerales bacterium]
MDISSILTNSRYSLYGLGQMPSKPSTEEMTEHLIEDKDKNGNGTLDAAELCISEELFKQVDTNGDGELTSEELIAGAEQIRKALGLPPGMPLIEGSESDEDDNKTKTLLDYLEEEEEGKNTTQTVLDLLF